MLLTVAEVQCLGKEQPDTFTTEERVQAKGNPVKN